MYPDLKPLEGKTLLVTGGTGMIGKWMVDTLLDQVDCHVIVTGRSVEKFHERFLARRPALLRTASGKMRLSFADWKKGKKQWICLIG